MKRYRTLSWTNQAPAPGAGVVFVPSPVQRTRLNSILFTFTAAAAVANRNVWLRILDPTGVPVFGTGSPTAIAANGVSDFVASIAYGVSTNIQGPVNPAVGLALPDRWLPPNWQVQIGVLGIQAADQISQVNWSAEFAQDIWDQEEDQALALAFLQSLAP